MEKLSDPKLKKFKDQNFDDIRANCLSAGKPWTDKEFGHDKNSLGKKKALDLKKEGYKIQWKRAHEINKKATLFRNGYDEHDVTQGYLGDCWFVASVASLALQHSLVDKVIPYPDKQQVLHGELGEDYCGALLFKFYRFGEWVEVVVDDYLPVYAHDGELVFAYSNINEPHEFWAAFMEKAYAKLDGSYGGLVSGLPADALSDLTGGICERIDFRDVNRSEKEKRKMYRQLKTALSRDAVVSLVILKSEEEVEGTGLADHHAYSLLRCYDIPQDVNISDHHMRDLVKVRNPWGHKEWTGKWRDNDDIWSEIPHKIKRAMDYENKNDGEYWMDFDDLVHNFTMMTICRMIKTDQEGGDNSWHYDQIYSEWVPGSTAGGCFNLENRETYFTNPQIQFKIEYERDETVLIDLDQRDFRSEPDKENLYIGFDIFKVPEGNKEKINADTDSQTIKEVTAMNRRSNYRQLGKKFELDVGTHVIIPHTSRPNIEGKCLLRIATETEAHVTELKD